MRWPAWRRRSPRAARSLTSAAGTAHRPWPSPDCTPRRRSSASTTTTPRSPTPAPRPPAAASAMCGSRSRPRPTCPALGYDLITFFDSLHDIGDPRGALARARAAVAPGGAVLLFEPLGADDVQDNLNPNGRMFYAVSTLACTPNAVSQKTADLLGAAGRAGRREAACGRWPPTPASAASAGWTSRPR